MNQFDSKSNQNGKHCPKPNLRFVWGNFRSYRMYMDHWTYENKFKKAGVGSVSLQTGKLWHHDALRTIVYVCSLMFSVNKYPHIGLHTHNVCVWAYVCDVWTQCVCVCVGMSVPVGSFWHFMCHYQTTAGAMLCVFSSFPFRGSRQAGVGFSQGIFHIFHFHC